MPCFSEFKPLPGSQPPSQASQPLAIPALGSSFQGSISPDSAVSAMNGSGGFISNNITSRGFTSNPLGPYTQSSQTPNPVPPIFQAPPQAGFLIPSSLDQSDNTPIIEDKGNKYDMASIDLVFECSESPLDSPHGPGLIALTEVDDKMRAFLNQEKAPQICSFQTKDVFVSRFGLALHDKEYFYNEVFVGK